MISSSSTDHERFSIAGSTCIVQWYDFVPLCAYHRVFLSGLERFFSIRVRNCTRGARDNFASSLSALSISLTNNQSLVKTCMTTAGRGETLKSISGKWTTSSAIMCIVKISYVGRTSGYFYYIGWPISSYEYYLFSNVTCIDVFIRLCSSV